MHNIYILYGDNVYLLFIIKTIDNFQSVHVFYINYIFIMIKKKINNWPASILVILKN